MTLLGVIGKDSENGTGWDRKGTFGIVSEDGCKEGEGGRKDSVGSRGGHLGTPHLTGEKNP